ncbi:hypothetical protein ACHAXH_003729 [Discostella pseudostelligera]
MVLSINVAAAADGFDATNCNENVSPLKRKSDLISPSCYAAASSSCAATTTTASNDVRCPLSEINTISEHDASSASSTTRQPTTSKTLTTNITYSGIKGNKFKSQNRPSKYEIEATNEKQATVNQLSEWLANETSKKNKKVPIIDRPPLSASDINLLRFQNKPRIKKADVEATDSKRVSVKTISSWMSDDPFEQKKVRTIRTGHKIIAKSRAFEKDTSIMANRTCDIKAGSVEEKSAWLSGAFKHEGTGDDSRTLAASSVAEKKVIRPYQTKSTKKEEDEANELKSVKDKKEWLSNAFTKKGSESVSSAMSHQAKSHEWHPIQQTRSYEVNNHQYDTTPSIVKSVSADNNSQHESSIHQTQSYDHGEESSSPENELKSVRDKKEWLSNAFTKKENEKGVIVGHHSKTSSDLQHPRHERTNPSMSLHQTKSLEMDNDKPSPSIEKSMSAENSQHVPMIHQTKSFDGPMAAAAATTTNIEKARGGAIVSLYQKETNEEKSRPDETLKTVKDKQAWLSSAFKTPSSSAAPATIGGATTQQQQKTKGVVADRNIAYDRSANATSVERQYSIANGKMHNESNSNEEVDLEKMSVADRAKWLKMAFK